MELMTSINPTPSYLRFCRSLERERVRNMAQARETRAWRREHGYCQRCGKNPASPGRTTCEACLSRKRAAYQNKIYAAKLAAWEESLEPKKKRGKAGAAAKTAANPRALSQM